MITLYVAAVIMNSLLVDVESVYMKEPPMFNKKIKGNSRAWQYQGHVFKYRLQGTKSLQIILTSELKAFLLKKVDF